jgi:hypothetical protein
MTIADFFQHNGWLESVTSIFLILFHIHILFNIKNRHSKLIVACQNKIYIDYDHVIMTTNELILFWLYVIIIIFGALNFSQYEWFCYAGIFLFDFILRPQFYRKPFKENIHMLGGQIISLIIMTLFIVILII